MEETTYHLIENYLDGNLTKEALDAFEVRLQNDAALAKKVNLLKAVNTTLGDPIRQNIQGQLNDLGATYFQQSVVAKKKISPLPFYQKPWVIAASFLLLVSIGFLFWQNQSITNLSNEQLFAQNYQAPNVDAMTRSGATENTLQEVIDLYKNQDYTNALVRLKELKQADPENQQLTYLLAHAYLNLTPPQLTEASNAFKALIQHNQNVYIPKAQWYLGLIYIRQNEVVAAKPLLQTVVNANDSNSEKAKQILQQLTD